MKARNDFFEKFENSKISNLSKVLGGMYMESDTSTSSSITKEGTFDTDSACPDCEKDASQTPNGQPGLVDYYSLDRQVDFWVPSEMVPPLRQQLGIQ